MLACWLVGRLDGWLLAAELDGKPAGGGARQFAEPLQLRQADGTLTPAPPAKPTAAPAGIGLRGLLVGGGIVTVLIAGVFSFLASGSPDGLERVAETEGFADAARDHALGTHFLADYGDIGGVPVGLAGLVGVVVTVVIAWAVFRLVGRRQKREESVST